MELYATTHAQCIDAVRQVYLEAFKIESTDMFVELSLRSEGNFVERVVDGGNWYGTLMQLWMMQTQVLLGALPNACVATLVARFAPEKKVLTAADWELMR